jgi:signal transduction histidine kinase
MSKPARLDLLQIFRYFTGMAMFYFAVTVVFTAIQTGEGDSLTQVQAYVNFGTSLIQLIYLSIPWIRIKLRGLFLPIALVNATVVPIFSNLIYLVDPYEDIWNIITRSWLLLPILIVPIVLIAWQYKFRYVVLIVIFSTYVELFVLVPHIDMISIDAFLILGGPLIRAFSFGTIGLIVNRLVALQYLQRKELILANVRLSEHTQTLEQLATSRERNRLARELHDTLAHTLSGQAVNLEAIKLMIPTNQNDVHQMLDKSLANTRAGLAETRRALKALRSQRLDDLGLQKAIKKIASDSASIGDFYLSVNIPDPLPELTPDAEQCIYRITQEALENIIRHSKADNVEVILEQTDDHLLLSITDDGVGFDAQNVDLSDKLGIRGMRERADLIGGNFRILSNLKTGTTVRFSLPIFWTTMKYHESINLR